MARPTGPSSLRRTSALLGMSKSGLHRAQQHVDFAGRYPWLQTLPQNPVLQIRRAIQSIPPNEHIAMMALLEACSAMIKPSDLVRTAREWCDLPEDERQLLYRTYT